MFGLRTEKNNNNTIINKQKNKSYLGKHKIKTFLLIKYKIL